MNIARARWKWRRPSRPHSLTGAISLSKPAPELEKTLAYLVPSILAGKRVIISTGTKNLQEQLYFKDLPFLESVFGERISACYMKGRGNYLCRQKLYDTEREPMLAGMEENREFKIIRDWEKNDGHRRPRRADHGPG